MSEPKIDDRDKGYMRAGLFDARRTLERVRRRASDVGALWEDQPVLEGMERTIDGIVEKLQ